MFGLARAPRDSDPASRGGPQRPTALRASPCADAANLRTRAARRSSVPAREVTGAAGLGPRPGSGLAPTLQPSGPWFPVVTMSSTPAATRGLPRTSAGSRRTPRQHLGHLADFSAVNGRRPRRNSHGTCSWAPRSLRRPRADVSPLAGAETDTAGYRDARNRSTDIPRRPPDGRPSRHAHLSRGRRRRRVA